MSGLRAILDAIGALEDAEIDLADAALQLARIDAPDADWEAARAHLSEIARDAARFAVAATDNSLLARANALSDLLCDHLAYRGDIENYDNLDNANLLRVIERRRGLPVALGIIWLHAAAAAGWPAYGVDLPGHFVIALSDGGHQRLVLDVFDGGTPLDEPAVRRLVRRIVRPKLGLDARATKPMSNRAVLVRLQSNIRLRRIQAGDLEGALICTEDTLRVAPADAQLWCELGILQERLDRVGAALKSYEQFLALSPPGPAATRVRAAVDELRTRLN
jgi:regulator of sirC expression with transglutaminase-like and TPR domain